MEVTFDIDANGILNVSAKDKASGREQKVTITASTNLNKAEIDRLDEGCRSQPLRMTNAKTVVEVRNQADTVAYAAEKLIKDKGGADHSELQEKVTALRQAMNGEDVIPHAESDAGIAAGHANRAAPPQTYGSNPPRRRKQIRRVKLSKANSKKPDK